MVHYAIGWLAIVGTFLAIDAIWLAFIARSFYQRHIGVMMREEIS